MRFIGGDVGGTKTVLRCVDANGATLCEQRFESADYRSFDQLLSDFVAQSGPASGSCFAVAGPVYEGAATLTNLGWTIDERMLAATFPVGRVELLNDFHAVALAVPLLGSSDLVTLQSGQRDAEAPMAVLGAGTGLGQAVLVRCGGRFRILATEGGHAEFAPQDDEQIELLRFLRARHGHVSWERVLSGAGLSEIHSFLGGDVCDPSELSARCSAGDTRALRTFAIFVDAYGAEAGNMALRLLARGGVFLAGGIAAKNVDQFTDGRFIEAFRRKGRFREIASTVPVDLIVNQDVGLIGAVEAARARGVG